MKPNKPTKVVTEIRLDKGQMNYLEKISQLAGVETGIVAVVMLAVGVDEVKQRMGGLPEKLKRVRAASKK